MMKSKKPLVLSSLALLSLFCVTGAFLDSKKVEDFDVSDATGTTRTKAGFEEFKDFEDIFRWRQDERKTQGTQDTSTSVNIFQKLKESLGAAILGILLIVVSPCLIWKNEGRHVRELTRIDFCKNKAVVVNCETASEETIDTLVHFVGEVRVQDDLPLNFENSTEGNGLRLAFPIPNGICLKRTCFIYQNVLQTQQRVEQNRIGGGEQRITSYSVRQEWTTKPQPPSFENVSETNSSGIWDALVTACVNETNDAPEASPIPPELMQKLGLPPDTSEAPHGTAVSKTAHVGTFHLSKEIIVENPLVFASSLIPVPNNVLPDSVGGCDGLFKGTDNILRTYPQEEQPKNGDCKVVYEYVRDEFDASFVVQQTSPKQTAADVEEGTNTNNNFGVDKAHVVPKCQIGTNDLGDIWMVQKGVHDLDSMIKMAKADEANVVKMIRIIGWLLLMVGWIMLFSPFTTALQVLPLLANLGYFAVVLVALIVSCLCCFTVSLLAYFRYRPIMSLGLIAIVGGIWALVIWRLDIAADTGGNVDGDDDFVTP